MIDDSCTPLLNDFYEHFLATEKSAEFIRSVTRHYEMPALHKLALQGRRVTRRAAVLAIGFLDDIRSNLVLGQALSDSDRAVRLLADHGIRQVWLRVGNPVLEAGLRSVVRLNQRQQFAEAVEQATELIRIDDSIAECWNQRAIALYQMQDYSHAVYDCQLAMELNPYHFLAALGSGNGHLELGEVFEALTDFRQALEINPDLDLVRTQINHLERIVEEG